MNSNNKDKSYFWAWRIHSISGCVLLIALFMLYLLPLSTILISAEIFDSIQRTLHTSSLYLISLIIFIAIPIAIRLVGLMMRIHASQMNQSCATSYSNWIYSMDKLAGVASITFIAIYYIRIHAPFVMDEGIADSKFIHSALAPGWMRGLAIAGIIAMFFHAKCRASASLFKWGITATRGASATADKLLWPASIVAAAMTIAILFKF